MIQVILRRPEVLALGLNLFILACYVYRREEPGKIIYWIGACLLTIGLLKMKG